LLHKIYYEPSHPSSFSSSQKLFDSAKNHSNITLNEVKFWLSKQLLYTLHKQRRKNFIRNRVIVENVNEQFQADLVDLQMFSKEKNGYKFILKCIDVLSKFAFAKPLKDKTGLSVMNALKEIFKSRQPTKIQTDKGKEFLNSNVQLLFKKFKINHFTSEFEEIKCSNVERFNRTLKSKMWKYFTANGTRRWIDILDEILISYNF